MDQPGVSSVLPLDMSSRAWLFAALLFGLLTASIASLSPASAQGCGPGPWSVTDTASLNAAIRCFNTVAVAGTYEIDVNASFTLTDAPISVNNSLDGAMLIVDGNNNTIDGNNSFRPFLVAVPKGEVAFTRITLTRGYKNNHAGAIFAFAGDIAVSQSTLTHNRADGAGGAIYVFPNAGSNLTITDTTVAHNRALVDGGGVSFSGGDLTITGSTVENNYARRGGAGIFATAGDPDHVGDLSIQHSGMLYLVG